MSKTCDEIVEVIAEIKDLIDQMEKRNKELIEAVEKAVN